MKSPEFSTFNGWGNILYGHKPIPDGYIATEWIVVFYIPLFPIKSYVVLGETGSWGRKSYQLRELPKLYLPQVIKTGFIGWFVILLIVIVVISAAINHTL